LYRRRSDQAVVKGTEHDEFLSCRISSFLGRFGHESDVEPESWDEYGKQLAAWRLDDEQRRAHALHALQRLIETPLTRLCATSGPPMTGTLPSSG